MTTIKESILHHNRKRYLGTLSVELMVAVAVMAALIGVLVTLGNSTKKVDDHHWTQLTLVNAGQAQMDAFTATGKAIDEHRFKRLWPSVTCDITVSNGEGQWAGLRKVQLHLSAKSRNQPVHLDLSQYIPPEHKESSNER